MKTTKTFDTIIVGGSYAGLSAAMALGRSMRHVLIIDSGTPCNVQTPHSHNFITQDGENPNSIAQKAKLQVLRYPTVQFHEGLAATGLKTESGFSIETKAGELFHGTKLIFATGIKDIMPSIPGFSESWGISVIHCPYCHGYEFRNKATGIMANGERAFHLASLINNLSDNITIFTNGMSEFSTEQSTKLKQHKIKVIETTISRVEHQNGYINALFLSDENTFKLDALYASLPFEQQSAIPSKLGCELTEFGHLKIDPFQRTTIPGIYACGDNAAMMRSVASAVYTGNLTGAMVNKELTDEQF